MGLSLKDKVAFVTGASQGIGRACALSLAEAGAKVVLASRNIEKLNAAAEEIHRACGDATRAFAIELDVSSEEAVKQAFRKAIEHFGQIDILVNNAGITHDGLIMRMKRQNW